MGYKVNIRNGFSWDNLLKDLNIEVTDSNSYFSSTHLDGVLDEIYESVIGINKLQNKGLVNGSVSLDTDVYDTFVLSVQSSITLIFSNFNVGRRIDLVISNGAAGVTWPTEVKWPNGVTPSLSINTDRISLQKISSSIIHGNLVGQSYS